MVTSDNSYLCDSSKGLKLNLVSLGEAPDAVLVLCYLFLTEDGSRLRCETKQSAPLNEEYQMGNRPHNHAFSVASPGSTKRLRILFPFTSNGENSGSGLYFSDIYGTSPLSVARIPHTLLTASLVHN
jgi:hypothetical protein